MAELQTLKDLVIELAERGVDLRGYKPTTLERRIRRRLHQLSLTTYDEYLRYFAREPGEATKLLDTLLINVTRFFRDPQAWDALAEQALPELFRNRPFGSPFRVWCAGCSTGEEAYSVAILLCELLGARVHDYEIKIYGTDHDDSALTVARRAQYSPERMNGMRREIRDKYFTGVANLQLVRDVRRMAIFGRSNLLADAPISRVDLLLCRNVLIYFDATAQAYIMGRLKYALNAGGVLFLGKSEPQLKRDADFLPLDIRWRIFQRTPDGNAALPVMEGGGTKLEADAREKHSQEMASLRLYYESILSTLEPGVLVLDSADTVITENDKVLKLWNFSGKLLGQKLQATELWQRCAELKEHLAESRNQGPKTVRFECQAANATAVSVTIKPILSESGAGQVGTLIYMENAASRVALQSTMEELETTSEELQASNEELETTNEELQSTNEELETTNEELQSTNEELETTNEELQSLNEELETTNEELTSRSRELDQVNARYSEMLERMPWPVLVIDDATVVHMFNSAAQKLFGFARPSEKGMRLQEVPLNNAARQAILRRHRAVMQTRRESNIKNLHMITNRFDGQADVRFTPLSTAIGHDVIVMFQVDRPNQLSAQKAGNKKGRKAAKPAKKQTAKKRRR